MAPQGYKKKINIPYLFFFKSPKDAINNQKPGKRTKKSANGREQWREE
jgi:hypothetical protein